jgi:hypothetical protein
VQIPAGSASVDVAVNAVDDAWLDGPQSVELTASADGYASVISASLVVSDYEDLSMTLSSESVDEDLKGRQRVALTLRRSNNDWDQPISVALDADETEVSLPDSVTIPAGSASVEFMASAVRDYVVDGDQPVRITASAEQYADGTANLLVRDDVFPWYNDRNPYDVNADGRVTPVDVLQVIEFLEGPGSGGRPPSLPPAPFYDVDDSASITPLDALLVISFLTGGIGLSGEGESVTWDQGSWPDELIEHDNRRSFSVLGDEWNEPIFDDIVEDVARCWAGPAA